MEVGSASLGMERNFDLESGSCDSHCYPSVQVTVMMMSGYQHYF